MTQAQNNDSIYELNQKKIKEAEKGFLGFFVKRHRFVVILVIGLTIWGTFSVLSLPREANPEVKVPFAAIQTIFPGASPTDIEQLITDPIENKIENVEKVKEITSSSSQSVSSIFVEFEADADLEKSLQDLRDAVSEVSGLPEDAEDPEVIEINFNDFPLLTISLIGNLTEQELKTLGEQIQDELEKIPGLSRAVLIGASEREILVELSQGELERQNISITQVATALAAANADFPLGDTQIDNINYNIRSTGRFTSAQELANIVVKSTPAGTILLGDIAEITDHLKPANSFSRISIGGEQPLPAVSLQIFKRTGGNIIEIVDSARQRISELEDEGIVPANVQVELTNDTSEFIRRDLRTLGGSGLQTIAIILILLTVALSFRKALLGALSIPLVFLMAFGFLSLAGSTINSLTLFSLVLSLGLLVDAMIVILEGIHDGLRQEMSPQEAALYAIATYKWPVTAGVFTTIAAFVPMFLVSGILGEFLKTFPLTIIITLGSSLFVGLVIMPGVAAIIQSRAKKAGITEKKSYLETYLIDRISPWYENFIRRLLDSKKSKRRFILSVSGAFVLSIAIVVMGIVPVELFPNVDLDYFNVNIELPSGTALAVTNSKTVAVEQVLRRMPEVKNFVTNVGSAQLQTVSNEGGPSGPSSENTAQIIVNLVDESQRDRKSFDIAADVRQQLAVLNGAKITVEEISGGPPTGSPIEIRVTGEDLGRLRAVAAKLVEFLNQIPGAINIQSDDTTTPPEFSFRLDHERLGSFGLTASSVGASLRASLEGVRATTINLSDEDIDVNVKLAGADNLTIEELKNFNLQTPTGQSVKLEQVADFEIVPALETIRHRQLSRLINVRADTEGASPGAVQSELESMLAEINLPDGVQLDFGGEVEDIQQSFTELWYSMSVAVILIFLIMILQFDSYRQPFAIMLTLPLAVIGVIFGTFLLGLAFGFSTFLGIVALAGIVVNDAIVLIDRINYNLQTRKMEIKAAIQEAGSARLQPIIITTLTTIAGVTPLAFVDEFWRGLSVSVAFGIAFATILTLGVVPVLYLKFQGKRWLKDKNEQEQPPSHTQDQISLEPLD